MAANPNQNHYAPNVLRGIITQYLNEYGRIQEARLDRVEAAVTNLSRPETQGQGAHAHAQIDWNKLLEYLAAKEDDKNRIDQFETEMRMLKARIATLEAEGAEN